MTLVLSVATPAYCLHVSDRLVSKGGRPHDPLANKTVVFRATDGLLVLGYTGPAFRGSVPTDTWLAEVLSASPTAGALSYGQFPVRDTGTSLLTLCRLLRADRQFRVLGGEVCAAGWQWSRRRRRSVARHVLWVLHAGSGKLQWQQIVPRHLPERKTTFRMVPTGDWPLSAEAWTRLLAEVGNAGADWQSVESLLVDAIRQASVSKPGTIGSHCMSVLLRPQGFPHALVRFVPATPHMGSAFGQRVEVAYTPWMVAPDALHAPSSLVGGLSCEQGLLSYSMEAPSVPAEQTLKAAFHTQQRSRP